jgi:hypothetical protein
MNGNETDSHRYQVHPDSELLEGTGRQEFHRCNIIEGKERCQDSRAHPDCRRCDGISR